MSLKRGLKMWRSDVAWLAWHISCITHLKLEVPGRVAVHVIRVAGRRSGTRGGSGSSPGQRHGLPRLGRPLSLTLLLHADARTCTIPLSCSVTSPAHTRWHNTSTQMHDLDTTSRLCLHHHTFCFVNVLMFPYAVCGYWAILCSLGCTTILTSDTF